MTSNCFAFRSSAAALSLLGVLLPLFLLQTLTTDARALGENSVVPIRFIDSATGAAVKPETVIITPDENPESPTRVRRNGVKRDGRTSLNLAAGSHRIEVFAPSYQRLSVSFVVVPTNGFNLVFPLDPIEPPEELQPARIASQLRENETLCLGYVTDADSGQLLTNVSIKTAPSGRETQTDQRGFFQIYVPLPAAAESNTALPRMQFSAPGFQTEERQFLELSSRGNWTYRVQLVRGTGIVTVDERTLRQQDISPVTTAAFSNSTNTNIRERLPDHLLASDSTPAPIPAELVAVPRALPQIPIRIPTHIRVLRQDGVTVDYLSLQNYCQRSLTSEWIPGWGSTGPGNSGTNALLAGAVAIRTYAIGFVNNPANIAYDICGTKACQAYHPNATDSRTTAAVDATINYVMSPLGGGRTPYKLTEYSAENNQLGKPCGDGYAAPYSGCLADPVCGGEVQFGHGRGMCQWGSARWATGRKMAARQTSDASTNGYPIRDWKWICQHYYPDLELIQGAPLTTNDFVQVQGTASVAVRRNESNGINAGINTPIQTVKSNGANGVIIGGPLRVTADGLGYTWWQVRWFDDQTTVGWSPENWLERVARPWNAPPSIEPFPNLSGAANEHLTFMPTVRSTTNTDTLLADFERLTNGAPVNTQSFSSTTTAETHLDVSSPDLSRITNSFPKGTGGNPVWQLAWNATTNSLPRELPITAAVASPRFAGDNQRLLKFDIYVDREIQLTTTRATNVTHSICTVPASNWTTVTWQRTNGISLQLSGLPPDTTESLLIVPTENTAPLNVYLDNICLSTPTVLTYQLLNPPPGATIDASTGKFDWQLSSDPWPGSYDIGVSVTDNNLPPQTDTRHLRILVRETREPTPPLVATQHPSVCNWESLVTTLWTSERLPPEPGARPKVSAASARDMLLLNWTVIPGERYLVEYCDDLSEALWIREGNEILTEGSPVEWQQPHPRITRFYRVQKVHTP